MKKIKNHTKIVATISDRRCDFEFIKALYDEGMNVARINTAHQMPETSMDVVRSIRSVSDKIAILVDTKGPEIRTKGIESVISLKEGDKINIKGGIGESSREVVYFDYEGFVEDVPVGSQILVDDGELELIVESKDGDVLVVVAGNSGPLKNNKSVNVPGVTFRLPAISKKDKLFIEWAADNEIDFIAHSFVRNGADVKAVQDILDAKDSSVKIIAKIENQDGVDNIDEILEHAYGVMVARGDLGIEIESYKIPGIQRELVRKCVARKKPVIIATQMLHTMIDNPRPTRAEVSDIASAIYSRTDAIMLSGETAYGDYPVEAVKVMSSIAAEVEASKNHRNDVTVTLNPYKVTSFLAEAAVRAAHTPDLNIKAIINDSLSGRTARYLSAFRPDMPVYAKCYSKRVMRELSLSYGIFASEINEGETREQLVADALGELVKSETLTMEDSIVHVGGSFGAGHGTTFLEVGSVEELTKASKTHN